MGKGWGRLALVLAVGMGPRPLAAQGVDWARMADDAVRALQEYVRIDTSNPPGRTTATADFLTRRLEAEGIAVTRYESAPGKAIVLARLKGAGQGKPILLLHHMDVVPADPSRWKSDPFSGALEDGHVWGRGSVDMKGTGIAHLFAFLTLKRQGVPLDRDVVLLAVPDEEIGGDLGAGWMMEHHYAELDPEYVIDEGGFGSRDLFADGKLVYGISVAEKKMLWLRVTAEGVAGHGSQPHDKNPNDRLVKALSRLLAEPMPSAAAAVLDTLRAKVGPLAANKYTNAIQHSTLSLTTLRSGVGDPPKVNVIPSIAQATLDCRLLPGVTREAWLAEVKRRLADPELKIEVTYESEDPTVTTQDTPLYRALEAAIVRNDPGAVVAPILVPYGTDSNKFRPRGVKSYGITPVVYSAEIAASMHGDAERFPAGEMGKAIRVLYEALRETAGTR
jgi:acetylornithine deacetylase/succinyl-diaminopimelate desuccinylase-like protein